MSPTADAVALWLVGAVIRAIVVGAILAYLAAIIRQAWKEGQ